jgi:hypothetical protein
VEPSHPSLGNDFPITLSCRCQDCGRVENTGFLRGRDLRLPEGWDFWGDDVRCGECFARLEGTKRKELA